MKQYFYFFVMIMFFLSMLLFPADTFVGASNGLLLWFQIVLPTLLPFLILSNLLIYTNSAKFVSKIINPFFKKIFSTSDMASYAILTGFLCGYPMGAKVIADLLKSNQISKQEGQYLLAFCNNASPMFIMSYVIDQNLADKSLMPATLFIIFITPVICSFIFRKYYIFDTFRKNLDSKNYSKIHLNFQIIDSSIMNGFETITKIGGYIIIFSIFFVYLSKLPNTWFVSTLEISNGILYLMNLPIPFELIYVLVVALTSFGGWCAIAQTYSMVQRTGLRLLPYIAQKLITTLVTSLFAYIYIKFIHQ